MPSDGFKQVVGGQHQEAGFSLGLSGQRHVDRHLVAVEVGVERGTYQRMQLDGAALDQHRLKGLDAQAVQGRRTVQKNRMVLDDNFQRIPHFRDVARSTIFRAFLMLVAIS